jgi:hypothetical protein
MQQKRIEIQEFKRRGLDQQFYARWFDTKEEAEDWADGWCEGVRVYFPRASVSHNQENDKWQVFCVRADSTGD